LLLLHSETRKNDWLVSKRISIFVAIPYMQAASPAISIFKIQPLSLEFFSTGLLGRTLAPSFVEITKKGFKDNPNNT